MKFNLKETKIVEMFNQDLQALDMDFDMEAVIPFFESVVITMGDFLGSIKDKEKITAVTINNTKNELELGAFVKYFAGEDGTKGHWNLVFTFNPEDITSDMRNISFNSGNLDTMLHHVAGSIYGLCFHSTASLHQSIIEFAQCIRKFLDANASETEKVELELPGFFTASVAIENGEKVFGFEAAEEIAQKVKNDAGEE